jgi:hypothetical protein
MWQTDGFLTTDRHAIIEILLTVTLIGTLEVKGADCTGSCKSNYHSITTTTTPFVA